MKNFIQQVVRKNALLLLGGAWLFTIAFIVDNYWFSSSSPKYLRSHIEHDIQQQEKDFDNLLKDTALLQRLTQQRFSEDELHQLTNTDKTPYCIFLYTNDEYGNFNLKFWNSQLTLPGNDLLLSKESNRLIKMRNGQYEFIRRQVTVGNGQPLIVVALIPVRREYFIEVKNLKKEFINYPQAEKSVNITDYTTDYPVNSSAGKALFYLQPRFSAEKSNANWLSLTLNIIAIVLLLVIIHNTAHYFSITYGYLQGIFFLVGMILVLRGKK